MSSIKEKSHNLTAIMVVEVMGKPKEHLVETLEKIITDIDAEKGVSVTNKTIHEPKELEKQKGFFSTFAEIEIEVDEPLILAVLMFKYMPSHMEIIEPEQINLTNFGYSDILNELLRRLHQYDNLLRVMQLEKYNLEKKLKEPKEEKKKE